MNIKQKFTTAIATGAVLLNALAPVSFAQGTDIQISGNGAFSDNKADVKTSNTTNVVQNNDAYIKNDVDVNANTGKNDASFNTGGDTSINTGDANVDVSVANLVNKNEATVNNCCGQNTDVLIDGNGAYSDNKVKLRSYNDTNIVQTNDAKIKNDVDVKANTGKNDASYNTGGDTSINTGDANVNVDLLTAANVNSATVGGDGSNGGTLSARILDNGAFSDNKIYLKFDNDKNLVQDNHAYIKNDVDVKANTGKNDASFNTGGDTDITTGDANARVSIDNFANFNAANIDDCGCFGDVLATIDGNGAFSYNKIKAKFDNDLNLVQDNDLRLKNYVDVDPNTGKNDSSFNTDGDSSIDTGDANARVDLNNHSNVNLLNPDGHSLLDLFDDFDFSFDLHHLMSLLFV